MWPALRRWWDRRQLRDARFLPLFEPYRGEEVVSLDLETSSMDPAEAQILSLAAVPVDRHGVRLSGRFLRLLRTERSFGIESIRVHRLLPGELAAGAELDESLDAFLDWLGNRPLLGYYLAFDLSMLDRHLRARHGFGLPNRRIELADFYARRLPIREAGPDLRLESIAQATGIPLMGRHSALGDAVSVGLIYAALRRAREA